MRLLQCLLNIEARSLMPIAVLHRSADANQLSLSLQKSWLLTKTQRGLRRFSGEGRPVSPKEYQRLISEYQENGVVCIRNLFDESWQKIAHQGIEKNFSNPSTFCDWLVGDNGKGVYFNDYMNWNKIDEFKEFILHSPAAMMAGLLMQSSVSIFFHEHVFVKKGVKNKAAPWHHDQAYYPINGMQNCTIWMPTTQISKETCLRFVKGSHRWGKWFHPIKFGSHLTYNLEEDFAFEYEDVPDVENGGFDILSWELEPGDCLAFHMKTLHGTKNSDGEETRYVLATRWLGDDAVFAKRPWKTSPPPETLPTDIKFGSNITENKVFPIIWSAESNVSNGK